VVFGGIVSHETHSREVMRWRLDFRVQLRIKNPLIEELMLWSHRRCDVVRAKVLRSHYPGAENYIGHQGVSPS
jgi:hypothetical protein